MLQIKKLSGIVEVDKTYIDGKENNKHANKMSGTQNTVKQIVTV